MPDRRHRAAPRAAAAAAAAMLALGAAGCAGFSKAFGQQEAVVQFQPGTPAAAKLHVRAACSHIPQVRAERLPTTRLDSAQVYNVRYQVGGASDAQLARLQQCLSRYPSVAGVNFTTPGQ